MKILVSNDDGISSKGIYSLAKAMSELGKVYVVAPESNQSAIGHAITMNEPLRCKKVKFFDTDIDAWWVNGTPADCIKLGIESIMEEKPDLVVSGINKGENLGTDVIYSGTVSAAVEGCIFNIPSIAISYEDFYEEDFDIAGEIAKRAVRSIVKNEIPVNTVFNINIPKCKDINEIKGTKVTKLGVKKYKNNFEERVDPRGNKYYWLAGELITTEIDKDTDIYSLKEGYVTVTPLNIDLTYYSLIERIKAWEIE